MYKKFWAPLLIAFATSGSVFSQQGAVQVPPATQKQDDTVRVGTSAVQLDVIVTDRTGRRINGLKTEDFQLFDEGLPQKLDFFTAIEGARLRDGAASNNAAEKQLSLLATPYKGRHIALVFDDPTMSVDNFMRARRALADYINATLGPSDMAAVISTGGSLGSLQQFTNDKQRLLSAINRISVQGPAADKFRDPKFHMTIAEAIRIDSGDTGVLNSVMGRAMSEDAAGFRIEDPTLAGGGPQTSAKGGAARSNVEGDGNANALALKEQIRVQARALLSQSGALLRANLKTLENLFRGMADLPGRKVAVLMTESLSTLGGTSEDISNDLLRVIDVARRSGVSVYALDAAGVRTGNVSAAERVTGAELRGRDRDPNTTLSDYQNLGAARSLVAGTGGELIPTTNDLASGIERAVEDSSTYYVLGFKPAALDNKFHRLSVSVKGQPDLIVRTRRGYLAIDYANAQGTQAELLDALMRSPVRRIDLPLEVVANVVPMHGQQVVLMGLHIGRNYLSLPAPNAQDQTVTYEVVSYAFPMNNDKPVGGLVTTVTYDLAKDATARPKLKTDGLVLVKDFTQLPPGNYQIRAVVREKTTGAVGSNYQFFEVPDLKNSKVPSLSGLVLTPVGQTGFSGHNSFKRTAEIEMRYIVYNLPRNASHLSQRVKLLDSQGQVLMDVPLTLSTTPAPDNQSMYPQGTQLSVPNSRGAYALIVTLQDSRSKSEIERRTDFVVE